MTDIDDRLHHAAESVRVRCTSLELTPLPAFEPTPGPRRPHMRVAVGALAAAVLVVAALVGVALHRHHARTSVMVSAPPTPSQIVALQSDGRIAVISATNGTRIRVLGESQGVSRFTPTLAVTPDGAAVYFTTSRPPASRECSTLAAGLVNEVARVPIRGGRVSIVGPGLHPAVSPNGRLLAYTRDAANPCSDNNDALVVLDLESGTQHTFVASPEVDLENLSWASDSVHLAYNQYTVQSPTTPRLLDTATAHTLNDAAPIPHATNTDWASFLGTAGAIGVTPHDGSHTNPTTVVELDATTGAVTRTLFTVPGGLAVGNSTDGPEDTLHADRSGRDVLAIGLLPVHAPIRHGALYRWHDGDHEPTLIAEQIWAAAWIEPTATTATTSP